MASDRFSGVHFLAGGCVRGTWRQDDRGMLEGNIAIMVEMELLSRLENLACLGVQVLVRASLECLRGWLLHLTPVEPLPYQQHRSSTNSSKSPSAVESPRLFIMSPALCPPPSLEQQCTRRTCAPPSVQALMWRPRLWGQSLKSSLCLQRLGDDREGGRVVVRIGQC